ncbi:M56 family metallopeptidase [Glutamicibacter halophytocola]|uniref:M56 family metallopeptidase n=1 Tax=Glutamicibacter halophytocola TaxID=1933880 RepID=UPI00321ABE2B
MPVAYCVPGISQSVTVLSRGLITQLTAEEQQAVISHERSHLDQRHDLLILAFTAWNEALPWPPTSKLSLEAVRQLIEMLADDKALEKVNRQTLLKAIIAVATAAKQTLMEYPASETHRTQRWWGCPAVKFRHDACNAC